MNLKGPDHRLMNVPWIAVTGELITALCFGCLGLFEPLFNWVSWPELLSSCHIAVVAIGSFAIAIALIRRRPEALKIAIVMAGYTGLPSLLSLSQALGQVSSAASRSPLLAFYTVWGLGMLGQVAVVFSCLGRLSPIRTIVPLDVTSGGVQTHQNRQ